MTTTEQDTAGARRISWTQLALARERGIISDEQARAIWALLPGEAADSGGRFDLPRVLYYLGGLLVIGAMTVFAGLGVERLGDVGLLGFSAAYAVLFAVLGALLWQRPRTRTAGGLLVTCAVACVPLVTYALQRWAGWWPDRTPGEYRDFYDWIAGGWALMEIATIVAAVVAIRWVRFAFLAAPLALAAWFLSMDLAPLLRPDGALVESTRAVVSLAVGLVLLAAGFAVDRRTREDFAFWLYLPGLGAVFGGAGMLIDARETAWAAFGLLSLLTLVVSVLLQRRTFLVFGGIGLFSYLVHLSDRFTENLAFPVVLSLLGLAVIALGMAYARLQPRLEEAVQRSLPESVRRALPQYRRYGERSSDAMRSTSSTR